MKTLILTLLLAVPGFTSGFDLPDTTKDKEQETVKEKVQDQKQIQSGDKQDLIDQKGTGEQNRSIHRKRKDVFIDKDGDGIADTRQGGMSFNKLRKRTGQKQGSGSGGGHNGGANQAGPGGK
jgi:hypothetical protein